MLGQRRYFLTIPAQQKKNTSWKQQYSGRNPCLKQHEVECEIKSRNEFKAKTIDLGKQLKQLLGCQNDTATW